jgi:hypothetical protein
MGLIKDRKWSEELEVRDISKMMPRAFGNNSEDRIQELLYQYKPKDRKC